MSDIKNDGGRAFPLPAGYRPDGECINCEEYGMTLRQWFAGKALQGMLANPNYYSSDFDGFATDAWKYADAMLKAREL